MKACRELDALVAEKVMGCKVTKILDYGVEGNYRYRCDCEGPSPIGTPPHASASFDNDIKYYSTDISAAWEVLRKIEEKGLEYKCLFQTGSNTVAIIDDSAPNGGFLCQGETPQIAICLAALKAFGVDV